MMVRATCYYCEEPRIAGQPLPYLNLHRDCVERIIRNYNYFFDYMRQNEQQVGKERPDILIFYVEAADFIENWKFLREHHKRFTSQRKIKKWCIWSEFPEQQGKRPEFGLPMREFVWIKEDCYRWKLLMLKDLGDYFISPDLQKQKTLYEYYDELVKINKAWDSMASH